MGVMQHGAEAADMLPARPIRTEIWLASVVYEDDEYWTDFQAFTTRDLAAQAIAYLHEDSAPNPPIEWRSEGWDETHEETNGTACPGWPDCRECTDWRGFVDGVAWYRIEGLTLYASVPERTSFGERWQYFSGVSLPSDRPDHDPYARKQRIVWSRVRFV